MQISTAHLGVEAFFFYPPNKSSIVNIELDALLFICSLFQKGRGRRIGPGNAERFFDLGDMFETDVFKCISRPGGISLSFAQLLPDAGAFLPVTFHELQVKKRKLVRQAGIAEKRYMWFLSTDFHAFPQIFFLLIICLDFGRREIDLCSRASMTRGGSTYKSLTCEFLACLSTQVGDLLIIPHRDTVSRKRNGFYSFSTCGTKGEGEAHWEQPYRVPSTVHRLPPTAYPRSKFGASVHRLPSTPEASSGQASTAYRPPSSPEASSGQASTVHRPPSTVHRPPYTF